MWPHSPPAHSRPDSRVGKRAASDGRHRGVAPCLRTSTRGNHMVRARGLVVLTLATFVAFACGGTTGGGGASKGTIKIGSDLPVCTTGGQSTANGGKFAVDQKNAAGGVEGYTIAFQSFDDCRQGAYNADARVDKGRKILDDSTVFGVGIAGAFEAEFKKLGGTVAQHAEYKKEQTSDFKSILLGFKNKGAAAVYVGGTDDQNICIPRKQMKDIGWDAPFGGGD